MFYTSETTFYNIEITCKCTGTLSVWYKWTKNILIKQSFEANIINIKQRRLDKRNNPILSSLQHTDDIPLPVAGLSLFVNAATTSGLTSK